jgi:hypothetical protein
MSAWIVTTAHVAALVKWYRRNGGAQMHLEAATTPDWDERMAGMLYAENVRSVNHRYADSTPDEPVAFTWKMLKDAPDLTPVEVIKSCQCLGYQSCECDDWNETKAKRLLDRIEAHAISKLPGYDAAPWGIEPATVTP